MITERTIHNYLKWLEKEEAKADKQSPVEMLKKGNELAFMSAGRQTAFAQSIRRLKKLLK